MRGPRVVGKSGIALVLASILFAILILSVSSVGRVRATTNNIAVVGLWHFDEGSETTVYDDSGWGNNGTLTNDPTWVAGKFGNALSFDGVDDYVDLGTANLLPDGVGTVSVWVKLNAGSVKKTNCLIAKGNNAVVQGWGVCIIPADSSKAKLRLLYNKNNVDIDVPYRLTDWHMVTVVMKGNNTQEIYLDGVLKKKGGLKTTIPNPALSFRIGGQDRAGAPYITNGIIDEVEIWNRALSADEIYRSYLGNPAGLWHFDKGKGTIAYDDSRNGNNGTLTNGPKWTTGKFGKALSFDGTNDYVAIADNPSLEFGSSNYTIMAWFKTSGMPSAVTHPIVAKMDGWGDDSDWQLNMDDDGNVFYQARYYEALTIITSGYDYRDGNWHHVVVTKTDGGASGTKLYVDGVLMGTGPGVNIEDSDVPVRIGASCEGFYFGGTIDEVAIYKRAFGPTAAFTYSPASPMTDDTIQFTDQSMGNDGTVVSWYWNFGDGATSTLKNPTHSYYSAGTYSIELTVTDDLGTSDTETKSITVVFKGGRLGDGLEIFCIERRPNYPRYWALYTERTVYDDYLPYNVLYSYGLGGGQDSNTQRHPNEGDVVEYVAYVYNMSENVFDGEFVYQWYFNGGLIRESTWSGTIASLEKAEISLSLTWQSSWLTEPHSIKFKVVSTGLLNENCLQELVTYTDAMPMYVQVEKSYYINFKRNTANVTNPTANSMVQWIQLHMIKFNNMFQEAGTKARVNYDIIKLVDDGTPLPPDSELTAYGRFPSVFHYNGLGDDWRFSSCYYSSADDIDYGYLHEVGHQLGLIDLYWLNSSNPFNGEPYWWQDEDGKLDLMSGCQPYISTYHALALDSWLEYNRGYFGQYLYDVPENNRIKILDKYNCPVANARIQIYQMGISEIGNTTVKFDGYTDSGGLFYIPNVKIDESIVPKTETGNQLRPNPFGYISMLGMNGVFLVKIQKDGNGFYEWLPITRFNEAYWRGNTSRAEYIIKIVDPDECFNQMGIWHFDEGSGMVAYDSSGYGNNGTLTNGPAWTTGKFGNALSFDGVDDYVDLGTANLLPYGVGTVSVWVKLNTGAINNNNYLIAKGSDATGGSWGIDVIPVDSSNALLVLLYGGCWVVSDPLPYSLTDWHMITVVMRGNGTQTIYLDGVLKKDDSLGIYSPTAGAPFCIGGQLGGGGLYTTNGAIDEVMVWNRILSASEISDLYN